MGKKEKTNGKIKPRRKKHPFQLKKEEVFFFLQHRFNPVQQSLHSNISSHLQNDFSEFFLLLIHLYIDIY